MSFKSIATTTSILAALGLGSAAFAQDSGFYIQGHGGANFTVQDDVEFDLGDLGSASGNYETDTGYLIGGAVGKTFANGLRSDLELTYRNNSINGFEFDDFDDEELEFEGDGDISSLAVMLNGYYDFATSSANWVPYIGGGIGYANVEAEDEDEGTFAYQAKAGIGRKLGNGGTLGAEASWFATPDLEFDVEGETVEVDYGSTALSVFYRQAL